MRRSRFFWGIVITAAGVILLLNTLGILPGNVWVYLWPGVLIFAGLWILLAPRSWREEKQREELSLPINGAARAEVTFKHGAGRFTLGPATKPGELLSGVFYGGIEHDLRTSGDQAQLVLHSPLSEMIPPLAGSSGYTWEVALTREIPLRVKFETGAGEYDIDLSQHKVEDLVIHTGASSMKVVLPGAATSTRVVVEAGASSVSLRLPDGVAARIQVESGLSAINVDTRRFPLSGKIYESPDFGTAANRIEIRVEAGVGSIEIR